MRLLYAAIRYPFRSKNSSMYSALIEELAGLGHEVRVITPSVGEETRETRELGIPVLRVKSGEIFNTNLIVKGLNTLLLNARYTRAIHKFWPTWPMDWVITSTPPITLSPLLKKMKEQYNAKVFLILRDIFPQNAKDLGMIKDPLLFTYFRQRERRLYKISDIIGCMSPGNIAFLKQQDPDIFRTDKLTYLPNWIQPSSIDKQKGESNFRQRFNLEGKFIALFGGNFGKPQKIEFIIDLAERVRHLTDVVFFLIGDGTEKERIRRISQQRSLNNVIIYDRLPHDEYQSLIYEADIGLVTLSEKFTIPNIPSRTLSYWDAALPVLAATDHRTDLNENLLKKYNAGLWSEMGNIEAFHANFMRLYQDENLRRSMGINGNNAVKTDFSVQTIARRLLEQVG